MKVLRWFLVGLSLTACDGGDGKDGDGDDTVPDTDTPDTDPPDDTDVDDSDTVPETDVPDDTDVDDSDTVPETDVPDDTDVDDSDTVPETDVPDDTDVDDRVDLDGLTGQIWAIDLDAGIIGGPPLLVEFGVVLIEVRAVAGDTLSLRYAVAAVSGEQDACEPTADADANAAGNPAFATTGTAWTLDDIPLWDVSFTGRFAADGTTLDAVEANFLLDIDAVVGAGTCADLEAGGFVTCEACGDGSTGCFRVHLTGLEGTPSASPALVEVVDGC